MPWNTRSLTARTALCPRLRALQLRGDTDEQVVAPIGGDELDADG